MWFFEGIVILVFLVVLNHYFFLSRVTLFTFGLSILTEFMGVTIFSVKAF